MASIYDRGQENLGRFLKECWPSTPLGYRKYESHLAKQVQGASVPFDFEKVLPPSLRKVLKSIVQTLGKNQ